MGTFETCDVDKGAMHLWGGTRIGTWMSQIRTFSCSKLGAVATSLLKNRGKVGLFGTPNWER